MLTRRQKAEVIEFIRLAAGRKLRKLIVEDREYTQREMATIIVVDPSRISEIMSPAPKPVSEITVRKLFGGVIVGIEKIIEEFKLTGDHAEWVRTFDSYENRKIVGPVNTLAAGGHNVIKILNQLVELSAQGVKIEQTLENFKKAAKK